MTFAELLICAASVMNSLRGENPTEWLLLRKSMAKSIHMSIGDAFRWN